MPIYDDMNERSSHDDVSPPETVMHRTYRGARDATRVATLMEKTEVFDPAAPAPAPAPAEPAKPPLPPRDALLAGRYELHEVRGRGATGVVYRGRDQLLDREVAVKLLYADLLDDHQSATRFQQEAQLAARVHHPHAVAIFDTGVHDGQPFIVMECLAGETLASRIATQPLEVDEVCEIGAQLLGALDTAHRQGVIHRDIKPANLLMTANGSVKVADFGIATSVDRTALTTVGSVVGTLAYLAPERLQGETATEQSDIYAVGVVLYEALTGLKPFASTNPAGLLTEISTGSPVEITDRRAGVGPALAAVVMRALARDPSARHASAGSMADALAAARKADRRSPAAAPVAMAAAAPPIDGESGDAASGDDGRRRRVMAAIAGLVVAVLATVGMAMADRDTFPNAPTTTDPLGVARVEETTVPTTTVGTTTTVRPATTARATTSAPTTAEPKGKKKKDEDD